MIEKAKYRIDPKLGAMTIIFGLVFALGSGLVLGGLVFWLLGWIAYFFVGWAVQGFVERMFAAYREEPTYQFNEDHATLAFAFWPGYFVAATTYVPLVLVLRRAFRSN